MTQNQYAKRHETKSMFTLHLIADLFIVFERIIKAISYTTLLNNKHSL